MKQHVTMAAFYGSWTALAVAGTVGGSSHAMGAWKFMTVVLAGLTLLSVAGLIHTEARIERGELTSDDVGPDDVPSRIWPTWLTAAFVFGVGGLVSAYGEIVWAIICVFTWFVARIGWASVDSQRDKLGYADD